MPGHADGHALQRRIRHADEHVGRGARRRLLARVDGERLAGPGEVDQHEAAAADARRLRLDDVERIDDGHRRVDRVAAGLEDLRAGLGAVRVRHRHHALPIRLAGPRRRLALGLRRQRFGRYADGLGRPREHWCRDEPCERDGNEERTCTG